MRSSTVSFLFSIALLVFLAPHNICAQSSTPPNPAPPNQDRVIQELLSEVRQLRIALQRMSVNSYRAQVLVERLRLQQEHVSRLTQELNATRNQINEMKAAQVNIKERLEEAEKQHAKGVMPESEVQAARAAIGELKRREQDLTERETQLSVEVDAERGNLTDLNRRLDALEREMIMTSGVEERKEGVKRQ